jgi:hypothetical protein
MVLSFAKLRNALRYKALKGRVLAIASWAIMRTLECKNFLFFLVVSRFYRFNPNILIILGPAGVGKTTVSQYIRNEHKYVHIEVDPASGQGTIGEDHLHTNFEKSLSWLYLKRAKDFAALQGAEGVVISYNARKLLDPNTCGLLDKMGCRCAYLSGQEEQIQRSFLARERRSERNFSLQFWIRANRDILQYMRHKPIGQYEYSVFYADGRRKPVERVAREILQGFGVKPPHQGLAQPSERKAPQGSRR